MINCEYYVPAWEGNKTSGPQPDFCLKYKVSLNGNCIKNCEIQTKLDDAVERHGDVVIGNKWDNPEPLKEGSV